MRRALLLLALLACGCGRKAAPPYQAFVPVVVRTDHGRWATRVELRNPGDQPAAVRVHRWPPDESAHETEEIALPPASHRTVPAWIPPFPSVSSYYFESTRPFEVGAQVMRRGGGLPPLPVPVLPLSALARTGDKLFVGPFLKSETERSHFCFTFPWTEKDSVPYRVEVVIRDVQGSVLHRTVQALRGLPTVVEDPWRTYRLPPRRFDLEVTLLGGLRGREPVNGLWVYGIVQDRKTFASWFLPTRVVRAVTDGG
jgi:hypothetical protein